MYGIYYPNPFFYNPDVVPLCHFEMIVDKAPSGDLFAFELSNGSVKIKHGSFKTDVFLMLFKNSHDERHLQTFSFSLN